MGHGVRFAVTQGHKCPNNRFFESPVYDFLLVINIDHSSKMLSFVYMFEKDERLTNGQNYCVKPHICEQGLNDAMHCRNMSK